MALQDTCRRLLALAETLHRWLGEMATLQDRRRARVALYAEHIAATLSRAAEALARLEADPSDRAARREAVRELGRVTGYVETLVSALDRHLDGRKLAGIKRRLEQLGPDALRAGVGLTGAPHRIERLMAAEGYFRAIADGLRA